MTRVVDPRCGVGGHQPDCTGAAGEGLGAALASLFKPALPHAGLGGRKAGRMSEDS